MNQSEAVPLWQILLIGLIGAISGVILMWVFGINIGIGGVLGFWSALAWAWSRRDPSGTTRRRIAILFAGSGCFLIAQVALQVVEASGWVHIPVYGGLRWAIGTQSIGSQMFLGVAGLVLVGLSAWLAFGKSESASPSGPAKFMATGKYIQQIDNSKTTNVVINNISSAGTPPDFEGRFVMESRDQNREVLARIEELKQLNLGKELHALVADAERMNPGLSFELSTASGGHRLDVRPSGEGVQGPIVQFEIPTTEAGKRGHEKLLAARDHGHEVRLDPGEVDWTTNIPDSLWNLISGGRGKEDFALTLRASETKQHVLVRLECSHVTQPTIAALAQMHVVRRGLKSFTLAVVGQDFAGSLEITVLLSGDLKVGQIEPSAVQLNFQFDIKDKPLKVVRKTILLWRAFAQPGALLRLETVATDAAIFETQIGTPTGPPPQIEGTLKFLDILETIETALKIRFNYQDPTDRDIWTAWLVSGGIERGAAGCSMFESATILGHGVVSGKANDFVLEGPPEWARTQLDWWKQNYVASADFVSDEMHYSVFGKELDVGTVQLRLINIEADEPLPAISARIEQAEVEGQLVRIKVKCLVLHEFERWRKTRRAGEVTGDGR